VAISEWSDKELRESVIVYIEMLELEKASKFFIKKKYYRALSQQFGRSEKAFEYRMQNISYILSSQQRDWLTGLKPAEHVGENIAAKIKNLLNELYPQPPSHKTSKATREQLYLDSLEKASAISTEQYVTILADIDAEILPSLREMLAFHAMAKNQTLSMEKLAQKVNYANHGGANFLYGKLGRKISDELNITSLVNQTQVFCFSDGQPDEYGHFQWQLRPAFFEAINFLGMGEAQNEEKSDTKEAAAAAFSADEEFANELPTTKKALIDARLGQGTYRRKMLHWWNGACAVTGCSVRETIIASHAISWKSASNKQRLDHFNGLPLIATLDALFDAGLIAFSDTGKLLIGDRLGTADLLAMGLSSEMFLRKIDPRHVPYLQSHRMEFGFS
jgi:putative restriction endonuclease